MSAPPLRHLRTRLEALACDDGEYYLVCGRSGARPVPALGLRFDSRDAARAAAHLTKRYRSVLRRYDSELPRYDVVVCQETAAGGEPARAIGCRPHADRI